LDHISICLKKQTSKKQVITIELENSVISSSSKRLTVLTL